MKIFDAKINMFFEAVKDEKIKFTSIRNKLSEKYDLVYLMNNNQEMEAPPEVPRLMGNSKNRYTELSISLNRITIDITFDDNYNKDIDKCIRDIKAKVKEIFEVTEELINNKYFFSGITFTAILDEINEDPVSLIEENLATLKANKKVYDIGTKFTYVKEDKYFININISNARGTAEVSTNIFKKANHLIVNLDVNDRYAFNESEFYVSDYHTLESCINISENICKQELNKVITGEELEI
ncbi:MAG: hypothetical protein ACRC6T_02760 [Sarcina sp.]